MNKLEQSWYSKPSIVTLLLLPFSGLYWLITALIKVAYRIGLKQAFLSTTPIIVVGNISVGGNGKTPFVIWLVNHLQEQGLKVAVISRGYGGQSVHYPLVVTNDTSTLAAGDEPVLIQRRLNCLVVVGPDRQASIKKIEQDYDIDVIISDDGMQHYKMARTIECCIVDAERRFGNQLLMPAGPLRETTKRLNTVDLVIENGGSSDCRYDLEASALLGVSDHQPVAEKPSAAHAVSAIGNPARFENTLRSLGVELKSCQHFRDHYSYQRDDFQQFEDDVVIMTEKDAVKCQSFAKASWYYLPVNAKPTKAVIDKLNKLLKQKGILNGL